MKLINESKQSIKKTLPIIDPVITSYTKHAHILSIIGNHEQVYPWIFSNYIQLYINKDFKYDVSDFYFPYPYELGFADVCRWILDQKIDKSFIYNRWESVIDFIINCIDSNNYVHTMINYFYIPVSHMYNKNDFYHDILIYGYDLDKGILYFRDFLNGLKYSSAEVSFSDFTKAFSQGNSTNKQDYLHGMVRLYKFNNDYDYKFNIKNIINSIKSYLSGKTPEYWELYNVGDRENTVFGVEIYTTLKNYIIRQAKGEFYIDIRPFYLLYDHKRIMCLRLKYLDEQGCFNDCDNKSNIIAAAEIEFQAKTIINLIIKYSINKNINLISRITNMLDDIRHKEYEILKQYI